MAGKQLWEQRANHVGRGVFEQERLRIKLQANDVMYQRLMNHEIRE